ncbi:MAG: PQQ-binding-like beta-propeller repeat protein, partial [Candidatus Omnitrophica bacterium]|nr:PQQ-binding-like beta-propeller repeat protein [Candidatus Omnitrophota bacterium]
MSFKERTMAVLRFFFIPLILFFQSPIFSAALPKPRLEWEFKAESNLYAPPLVADFHPNLGQEVVFSDTEARKLVCLSATGEMIWEYDGGWTKRLISGASLSFNAVKEGAAILIGNPDGTLHCLDARSGRKLWATQVGEISWTNAIWADVDGDGRDEAVAATRQQVITCLRSDGSVLWKYPKGESSRPSRISSTISAADVDGDGASEVFFCSLDGPVALDGNGDLLWETPLGDYYLGSLVLGDADFNGSPEVYSCSVDESALVAFDARTGECIWRAQMRESEHSTSGSSLALGDLDFDGQQEILVGDETGAITCFDCRGGFQWLYQGTPKTRAALSLGDVDGDGDIEILAASGDRTLTCLDSRGNLEWSWETDRRLLAPATLTDLDEDGRTEIVFGSCDRLLRVLTLEGRYDKDLIPWPSARFDSPQSGSSLKGATHTKPRMIEREESLYSFAGFEHPRRIAQSLDFPRGEKQKQPTSTTPEGWRVLEGAANRWSMDSELVREGKHSIRIGSGTDPFVFTTSFIEVPRRLSAIQSEIFYHGPGFPKATLCWWNDRGIVREDEFNLAKSIPSDASDTWVRLSADQVKPPQDANRFQLICSNPMNASGSASWWDGGALIGKFREPAKVESLVNQVGYDIGAPKRFTVQSNFLGEQAIFEILSLTGESVFAGRLEMAEKISGAYGNDWG